MHLARQFFQAQFNGLEETRQFLEPLGRGFPHKTWIHQVAQLLFDIVQGHGLGQVDLAFEAFLQAVPELQHFQGQARQAFGVLSPTAALAFSQGCQASAVPWQAIFAFKYAGIEAGQQDVFHQRVDTPQFTVHQAQLGQARQFTAQEFRRFRQLLHQQALQGATVLELGFGGGREAPLLDRAVLFHQCRVHCHR